jgi:prolyl 4-hydroxylase
MPTPQELLYLFGVTHLHRKCCMSKKDLFRNQIFTIENFLSPVECAEYINFTENIGYSDAPITTNKGFEMRPEVRNNQRVIFDDKELAVNLWKRVSNYMPNTINRRHAIGLNERFRFYKYSPGQRFAPHKDGSYSRPNGEESYLTFMIYLNSDFEGGETCFYLPNISSNPRTLSVIPVTGMALYFFHELLHEGTSVTQQQKYVLRTDVMYKETLEISMSY